MSVDHPRPIFWFLWPQPDPNEPLDGDARQVRLIRIPGRGPLRVLLLASATIALAVVTGTAIMAAIGTSWLLLFPVSALIATFLVLLLRAWTIGTYVNDERLAVQRLFGTDAVRWNDVRNVVDGDGAVLVTMRSGHVIRTHISRRSIDILWSGEGFDAAKLALQRWGEHS